MHPFLLASFGVLLLAGAALADRYFANIIAVDPDKRTIVMDITAGLKKGADVKAPVAKDCVIRDGEVRLGKPARIIEGDVLVNGLKNFIFEKVSREQPVRAASSRPPPTMTRRGSRRGT